MTICHPRHPACGPVHQRVGSSPACALLNIRSFLDVPTTFRFFSVGLLVAPRSPRMGPAFADRNLRGCRSHPPLREPLPSMLQDIHASVRSVSAPHLYVNYRAMPYVTDPVRWKNVARRPPIRKTPPRAAVTSHSLPVRHRAGIPGGCRIGPVPIVEHMNAPIDSMGGMFAYTRRIPLALSRAGFRPCSLRAPVFTTHSA